MSMHEINSALAKIGQKYYSVDSNRCIVRCKRNEFLQKVNSKRPKTYSVNTDNKINKLKIRVSNVF